ncbi:uncharacterized protein [Ptychodera flava]
MQSVLLEDSEDAEIELVVNMTRRDCWDAWKEVRRTKNINKVTHLFKLCCQNMLRKLHAHTITHKEVLSSQDHSYALPLGEKQNNMEPKTYRTNRVHSADLDHSYVRSVKKSNHLHLSAEGNPVQKFVDMQLDFKKNIAGV